MLSKDNVKRQLVPNIPDFYIAIGIFLLLTFVFFYRIFLGELYSPSNMYYHQLPWSFGNSTEGLHGNLFSDIADFYLPVEYYLKGSILNGEIPLWISHSGLGTPFTLDLTSFMFPLNWIYLLLPINIAFTFDLFIRFMVCQIGMYMLLRDFKLGLVPSVIGAIIFNFSMPMVVWLYWPHTEVSMLAPWLLWAIRKIMIPNDQINKKHYILISVIACWMLVIGMPAYAAFFFYIVSIQYLFYLFNEYGETRNLASSIKSLVYYGTSFLIGILLAMPYIISFLVNSNFTKYVGRRITEGWFLGWEPDNLLHFIDPNYYLTNPYPTHYNELGCYFGILSIFLVVYSFVYIIKRKQKQFYVYLFFEIILLGAVFNLPIFSLIRYLPLISISAAYRLVMPLMFVSAILSAKSLDLIFNSETKVMRAGLLITSILLILILTVGANNINNFTISKGMLISLIILLLSIYFIFIFYHNRINKYVLSVSLIMIMSFDLMRGGINYNPSAVWEKSTIAPQSSATDFLMQNSGDYRFMALGNWVLFPNASIMYGINDLAAHSLNATNPRWRKFYEEVDNSCYGYFTRIDFTKMDNLRLTEFASTKYIFSSSPNIFSSFKLDASEPNKVPAGALSKENVFEQEIFSENARLCNITLLIATYGKTLTTGSITLQIVNSNNEVVREIDVENKFLHDNQSLVVDFDPIDNSKGQRYSVRVFSKENSDDNAPTIWMYDYDKDVNLNSKWNGGQSGNDLMFDLGYRQDGLVFIDKISDLYVFENSSALPRAYLTGNVQVETDPELVIDKMVNSLDNTVAIVENSLAISPAGGIENVYDLAITSNMVSMKTNSNEDKLLVMTDLNYPEWKAYVDGNESRIHSANYLFRGVEIPKGEHTIIFKYEPTSFYLGISISLITLLALIIYCFMKRKTPPLFRRPSRRNIESVIENREISN